MKRHACQLSLIIAALAAAPAALAGGQVIKCVAPDGQVTLTDQPCSDGAAAVKLESETGPQEPAPPRPALQPALQHFPAQRTMPPRTALSRPVARRAALPRDVATLKEARAQLMLMDGRGQHPRLATLD
jgi:hypothetical protein